MISFLLFLFSFKLELSELFILRSNLCFNFAHFTTSSVLLSSFMYIIHVMMYFRMMMMMLLWGRFNFRRFQIVICFIITWACPWLSLRRRQWVPLFRRCWWIFLLNRILYGVLLLLLFPVIRIRMGISWGIHLSCKLKEIDCLRLSRWFLLLFRSFLWNIESLIISLVNSGSWRFKI